jgi:hypothetical protein
MQQSWPVKHCLPPLQQTEVVASIQEVFAQHHAAEEGQQPVPQ